MFNDHWENRVVEHGVHYSRYIASWLKVGGLLRHNADKNKFKEWLLTVGCSENEADEIADMATIGKYELQNSAIEFLQKTT